MQELINGLTIGSIYALVAAGLLLIFGILEIPDFALGGRLMVGAYVAFFVVVKFGMPYWLGVIAAVVAAAMLGGLSELIVYRHLRRAPPLAGFVGALTLLIMMETGAQLLFGANYRKLPTPLTGSVWHFWGVSIAAQRVLAGAVALVLIVALFVILRFTRGGTAVRATIEDRSGALLMGISPNTVAMIAMVSGSALAGAAGGLIAPIYLVNPTMGTGIVIKAFIIIILAGMRSNLGAIVAALLLGLIESYMSVYVSAGFTDAYGFVFLIVVLMVRPSGLFVRTAVER